MSLLEMARQFPDLSVTIRLGDLLEANESLARRVRADAEAEIAARERSAGCRLIPKDELVRMLGVDPSTLWRWENEYNYLLPVRFGRKIFYRESDVQAIIEAHSNGTRTNH